MKYEELPGKPDLVFIQKEILDFWKKERVFEKSVEERTGEEVVIMPYMSSTIERISHH